MAEQQAPALLQSHQEDRVLQSAMFVEHDTGCWSPRVCADSLGLSSSTEPARGLVLPWTMDDTACSGLRRQLWRLEPCTKPARGRTRRRGVAPRHVVEHNAVHAHARTAVAQQRQYRAHFGGFFRVLGFRFFGCTWRRGVAARHVVEHDAVHAHARAAVAQQRQHLAHLAQIARLHLDRHAQLVLPRVRLLYHTAVTSQRSQYEGMVLRGSLKCAIPHC